MENKYHVLIVDDVVKNLQVVSNILSIKDIDVSVATDGKSALSSIEVEPPDLILLDISMPNMDGFEVCKIIKSQEKTKDIPIIFLSAKNEQNDIIKGLKCGAIDYVTKPFNTEELLTRVITHLELKHSKDIIERQNNKISSQNKKIKKQNTELSNLNKAKDKIFSIIAHDLKNPFHLINNLTKLLYDNYDQMDREQISRFLSSLHKTSSNGTVLLENLLEWSHSQTGRISVSKQMLNINKIINSNITLLKSIAEAKKINVINNIDDNQMIYADENLLSTVIRNLLSNALKFTYEEGNITISNEYSTVENEKHQKIMIQDSGIGIAKDDQKDIFNIDRKKSVKGTNNEKGTGLGLILCEEFIKKQGGVIGVYSKIDKGSCFHFSLPENQ